MFPSIHLPLSGIHKIANTLANSAEYADAGQFCSYNRLGAVPTHRRPHVTLKSKLLGLTAVFLLLTGFVTQRRLIPSLFSASYLPHRYCYLAQPGLIWTNASMDALIAASYALIFGCLFWVAGRLRHLADLSGYLWIFISFGTFILACGATHVMDVITVWWPLYPLSAAVKVVCAAASVPTAILFARATPAIAANIRRFLTMLSTTQQEKDQAVLALIASEKLAVAGRITATIAHEVKNPLDSIGNILYLLQHDPRMPEDLHTWINTATSELERASGIAHSTLSLYRDSKSPAPIALDSTVRGVLDLEAAEMLKRNITLETRLRSPSTFIAYSSDFQQILINLLQNAAAAIGKDGRILFRLQPRQFFAVASPGEFAHAHGIPGYSITIADDGPGIEKTHRPELFKLFFTTKGDQGTGVGLWLVRSMVEKHGGRIRFRSRTASETRTHGTVFNVWLPLVASPLATSDISPAHESYADQEQFQVQTSSAQV
jgi:signal transduction histidine kinase